MTFTKAYKAIQKALIQEKLTKKKKQKKIKELKIKIKKLAPKKPVKILSHGKYSLLGGKNNGNG